jgi:predicted nucleic acid-binding protein
VTAYFLDSSAVITRYVPEAGTAWVRAMTMPSTGNTILVAQMTQAELISGIRRRVREGTIAPRVARAIRLLLDRHTRREYLVMGLTAPIVHRAEDLLEQHALRAYDAVQLASALESNTRLVTAGLGPLVFVAADTRLLAAASPN